jgi:hypothetical protein
MMKDRKYIEDAYNRIQSQKILDWVETQLTTRRKRDQFGGFYKNGGNASTPSSLRHCFKRIDSKIAFVSIRLNFLQSLSSIL